MLTQDFLKELLHYDRDTGLFTSLKMVKSRKLGDVCNRPNVDGYVKIKINNFKYMAHRLAWLYEYGEFPEHEIDHIDGNKSNNAITNLRAVPHAVNQQNKRKPQKNNKTGFLGVVKCGEKYYARIRLNRKAYHLGVYVTPEEAHRAYLDAKRRMHIGCTI